MSVSVVIGGLWGDEGKGITTEYLCRKDPDNTLVVRFSGGHQCGHKVVNGKVEHIFSNFGSGTLLGCPTYWSEYCTFEPFGFVQEYKQLVSKGISPKIFIHPECPVVTAYDIATNRTGSEREHGTCGSGFYRTKKRHLEENGVEFTVGELIFGSEGLSVSKLDVIRKYYDWNSPGLTMDYFFEARDFIWHLFKNDIVVFQDTLPEYKHYIFEGNQGLMLDPEIGTMPHCTPSDCTPRNIIKMGYKVDEVYLVTRCYQTRHGNGPMTNEELPPPELKNNERETNVDNDYQGVFRRTILDLDQLIHAKTLGIDNVVPKDTKVNLVVTCMDQMQLYQVTQNFSGGKQLITSGNPRHFVEYLGRQLGINGDLLINTSPESRTIRRI